MDKVADEASDELVDDELAWSLPGTRISRRAEIYAAAAKVAARYSPLALPRLSDRQRAAIRRRADEKGARNLHDAAIHLRGGFLKLGQFASARPDLLPEPYVRELSKLQDRVPPAPAAVIRRTIEEDVKPVDELFASFEDDSASAASLAQVHRATRHDGRRVAVKVQYPRVRELVPQEARDTTRILGLVAHLVKGVDLPTIARALERNLLNEIDYEQEAAFIDAFQANFADEPQIEIPGVHPDSSNGRVLVMDWVEGENLARALASAPQEEKEEALRVLVDAYLKQILVDGLLHADPHPGNFLWQSGERRLGMVDFGACERIPDATRLALHELYHAGMEFDLPRIGEALHELGFRTRSGDIEGLVAFASLFTFESDDQASREENWNRLVSAARENPLVKIPDELIMVGRVLIVQTGLVGHIEPSWDMDELVAARLEEARAATGTAG
jgi:predicted unusual protein kinase regulating ubiquinone biosynthesis (AarF/ABC1/UbiB family)